MKRRALLHTAGSAGVAALAGCTSRGDPRVQNTTQDTITAETTSRGGGEKIQTPLPDLEWGRHSTNPLIEGRDETQQQAGFGGIVHTPNHFENPIDEWYFYWAGHDKGGVWLSTAPSPRGPWTAHGRVFDISDLGEDYGHVSSPYPAYNPIEDSVYLYYHKAHYINGGDDWVQDTHYAALSNEEGTTVQSHHGEALAANANGRWDEEERSYLKILRTDDQYIGVYQGCDHECRTPKIGFCESADGEEWTLRDTPLFGTSELYTEAQTAFSGTPHLTTLDGTPRVLFQWIPANDGTQPGIYSLNLSERDAESVVPEFVFGAEQEWTKNQPVHVVDLLVHDETVYLYYSDSAGDDEQHIGVASAPTK